MKLPDFIFNDAKLTVRKCDFVSVTNKGLISSRRSCFFFFFLEEFMFSSLGKSPALRRTHLFILL